jgi:hypothetical protein
VTRAKQPRPAHDARSERTGRYVESRRCDACGRPCGTDYGTDDDVCGGSDGPGFFLCLDYCNEVRHLGVEERRHHYTAQRARNDARERARRAGGAS